ncbi:MAG TPA: cytochrome c-type biogenesis protein [Acetobacteraceae bacterium]|nr:cytochrome c-type biogenesis protein [Acetobacteraceae bacterium]
MRLRRAQAAPILVALLAMLCLLPPPAAHALSDPSEMLANPAQEKRAEQIGDQLRCLVCQNESIEQSGAGLARDLRHIIRQQVAAGKTNKQIIAWMVARYGDFVLLKPPFAPATLLLWGAPVLALCAGTGAILLARRRPAATPAPLTDEERQRATELLGQ